MKKFYHCIFTICLVSLSSNMISAQITCLNTLEVELEVFSGTAAVTPEMIVVGTVPQGTTVDVSEVTCANSGIPTIVTATAIVAGNEVSCWTTVIATDDVPPVAIADQNVIFSLPAGFNSMNLNPFVIDDGSYDHCSDVTLYTIPEKITCADVGQTILVYLYVVDKSLNINSAVTEVTVVADSGPVVPIECIDDVTISLLDTFLVTEAYINDNSSCSEINLLLTNENGGEITDHIIKDIHDGQTLTASLTLATDNSTCSTLISVQQIECDALIFCDTKCNEAPLGDCESGHTDHDLVEWPCDIEIDGTFEGLHTISPSSLVTNYGVAEKDSKAEVFSSECFLTATSYEDNLFNLGISVKVVRTWHALEWQTGTYASYDQVIVFGATASLLVWNICDTESNETELGDCNSGHTDSDDIEWPMDVFALDHRILPNQLASISNIAIKDTRPAIVANPSAYRIDYVDVIRDESSNNIIVDRNWTVTSTQNSEISTTYTQQIHVAIDNNMEHRITVTTHSGRPVPGVIINGEYLTDNDGALILVGEEVSSVKVEDDPLRGLDIKDAVLMYDYILGATDANSLQVAAMDIDDNGIVSTLDMVHLKKLILGENSVDDFDLNWRFQLFSQKPWVATKADYGAYKKGDVDDSVELNYSLDPSEKEELIFSDVLLNNGEDYEVEFRTALAREIKGGQLTFEYDQDVISLLEIESELIAEQINWRADGGVVRILFNDENPIDANDDVILKFKISASANATLSDHLRISKATKSFFINDSNDRVLVDQKIENRITSDIKDIRINTSSIKTFPNPATDLIAFDIEDVANLKLRVFDIKGQLMVTSKSPKLDISTWNNGLYFFQGHTNNEAFSGKFVVRR